MGLLENNKSTRQSVFSNRALLPLIPLLMSATSALAHEAGSLQYGSFWGGITHPVLGVDHFLAMVSVGVLSAQMGGRAIWTVPTTFVCVMAIGGLLGLLDIGLGAIELGIAFSVLILGLAIAAERNIPVLAAMVCVGAFAIFHGYAHGNEMPEIAQPVLYASGFLTGTAALHITGLVIGDISQHYAAGKIGLRVAGVAIAVTGGMFLIGAT